MRFICIDIYTNTYIHLFPLLFQQLQTLAANAGTLLSLLIEIYTDPYLCIYTSVHIHIYRHLQIYMWIYFLPSFSNCKTWQRMWAHNCHRCSRPSSTKYVFPGNFPKKSHFSWKKIHFSWKKILSHIAWVIWRLGWVVWICVAQNIHHCSRTSIRQDLFFPPSFVEWIVCHIEWVLLTCGAHNCCCYLILSSMLNESFPSFPLCTFLFFALGICVHVWLFLLPIDLFVRV